MKWFQKANGSKPVARSAMSSDGAGVEAVEAMEDSEYTERSAIPDEVEGDLTPSPEAERTGRSNSGRRLTRTVASPIPAMLAESMSLAEEPPPPATPVQLLGKPASRR